MITPKKLVSVYLPEELYQALISHQEQQKFQETSEAVVGILAQFFQKGDVVKRYATLEELEVLEGKVSRLSEQVAQLSQVVASSAQLEAARAKPSPDNEYAQLTNQIQPISITFGSTSFDEEEDEPDEILYDFLEPERPSSSNSDR